MKSYDTPLPAPAMVLGVGYTYRTLTQLSHVTAPTEDARKDTP